MKEDGGYANTYLSELRADARRVCRYPGEILFAIGERDEGVSRQYARARASENRHLDSWTVCGRPEDERHRRSDLRGNARTPVREIGGGTVDGEGKRRGRESSAGGFASQPYSCHPEFLDGRMTSLSSYGFVFGSANSIGTSEESQGTFFLDSTSMSLAKRTKAGRRPGRTFVMLAIANSYRDSLSATGFFCLIISIWENVLGERKNELSLEKCCLRKILRIWLWNNITIKNLNNTFSNTHIYFSFIYRNDCTYALTSHSLDLFVTMILLRVVWGRVNPTQGYLSHCSPQHSIALRASIPRGHASSAVSVIYATRARARVYHIISSRRAKLSSMAGSLRAARKKFFRV